MRWETVEIWTTRGQEQASGRCARNGMAALIAVLVTRLRNGSQVISEKGERAEEGKVWV